MGLLLLFCLHMEENFSEFYWGSLGVVKDWVAFFTTECIYSSVPGFPNSLLAMASSHVRLMGGAQ